MFAKLFKATPNKKISVLRDPQTLIVEVNGKQFIPFNHLALDQTALVTFTKSQKTLIILMGLVLVIGLLVNWLGTLIFLISALTLYYLIDLLFSLFLVYKSYFTEPELKISEQELEIKRDWPSYTVFCPLYKEWQVLPQFINAMKNLDYPEEKLQVMLLLEENDPETIQKAREMVLPKNFQIVVVPDTKPKTKPKAMNYGLKFATGDYCVIFDAEDVPEKDQLKKVVLSFEKVSKETVCIQAKLNFYNPNQNLLTRLFCAEYSLWFDLVLTGLQSINAPIPLGGTSNHFITQKVRELNGWDAFNVTEDADLGMRLAKLGFRTAIVDSTTYEEANSHYGNWFKQRARWIKGYMQTYLVHMRRPEQFLKGKKSINLVYFQLVIGGKILSMLINPFMWLLTITYFVTKGHSVGYFIESLYLAPILYIGAFTLFFGNFLYTYYFMMGLSKRHQYELIPFALLTPIYWIMMSISAVIAFQELLVKPHHWNKTVHGFHLQEKTSIWGFLNPLHIGKAFSRS